ncbi:hypothetical protein ABZ891_33040 [Streptomyces sp. NPDC047023]|uniref:hypothetical protein n=1 Tax=Streptomyces sp. NPDC047023 TaxID=3155139 RepID=UPI0033D6F096
MELLLLGVVAGMGGDGRLVRGVVVRRLLAMDQGSGSVSSLHVRVMAEAAGVSVRTVWRWLSEAREGRLEPVPRHDRFTLDEEWWTVLAEVGGNVAALCRRMTDDASSSVTDVPSLATLHRALQQDLRAGRVLAVARPARNRVEASRYDRALADLKLQQAGEGLPVVDTDPVALPEDGDGGQDIAPQRAGVRLFVPGARVVSTAGVAAVVESVGHTIAARGIGCWFGDPGVGKTVAVQQALHLLPSRVPVWRAVVAVSRVCLRCAGRCWKPWACQGALFRTEPSRLTAHWETHFASPGCCSSMMRSGCRPLCWTTCGCCGTNREPRHRCCCAVRVRNG